MSLLQQMQGMMAKGAAVFDPSSNFAGGVAGAWWDPSDFSTMFQDAAGTTPVTAVGQSVGKLNDKSGNGYHLTQSTSTARPVLQQDANGKYYLQFSPTGGTSATWPNLVLANTNTLYLQTRSLMAVSGAKFDASASGVRAIFARSLAGSQTGRYALINNSGPLETLFQSGSTTIDAGSADSDTTNVRVITSLIDRPGGSASVRTNGTVFASKTFTPDTGTSYTNANRFILGAYNNSADTDLYSAFFGRVYGLILRLSSSIDTTLLSQNESWMAAKCGVSF